MSLLHQLVILLQKHLFVLFLIPQLLLILYASYTTGFNECYADRLIFKRKGFSALLDPYNFTLLASILIVIYSCVRRVNGKFVIMVNIFTQFLNAYMFHRSFYYIFAILKVVIGDTQCSVNNAKYNSISGHFFTALYFFGIFVRMLKKLPIQPKQEDVLFNFELCELEQEKSKSLYNSLHQLFSIDSLENTKHAIIGKLLLLIFSLLCLLTMADTLLLGYHTPRQVCLGILFGVGTVIMYGVFVKLPFKYRSVINFITIILSYFSFCLFSGYHLRFSGFFITAAIALILTYIPIILPQTHTREE